MFRILRDLTADGAVRYGIKFGLAGMLAVFIALVVRIPQPTWALFTVFVLMIAQYVGAIGEKSVFRLIGTVIGGVIGYVLTGSLQQNPVLYLTLVGAVVGFCTAMFGQSRYPYAFLLCGLTTVVVTSNGLANPGQSWEYMLWRVEEVGIGIIATLLVQTVIWPRYARVEFLENLRAGFRDVAGCFEETTSQLQAGASPTASAKAADFPARITALRGLLEFGARESQHFRDRIATYFELTICLSRIASAISTLQEALPPGSIFLKGFSKELGALHQALHGALVALGSRMETPTARASHLAAIDAAITAISAKVNELRGTPGYAEVDTSEALIISVHILAFQEMRKHIAMAHHFLDSLPSDPLQKSRDEGPILSPWPSPFWKRVGVRAGIAVAVALLIYDWLNPPGGPAFVLSTWVFTALNATSPGGRGDHRAFDFVVAGIMVAMALSIGLIAFSPLLSSYAVMNTVLAAWLFVWGFLSYRTRGVTIPMQIGMLFLVGILGLNGQEPVKFQQIVDFFFSTSLGLLVASVIQRVLWPSLPQWEIRDRLLEMIAISRRVLRDGPENLPLWQRTRLALIPGEVLVRLPHLTEPAFPAADTERLRTLLGHLTKMSTHLIVSLRQLDAASLNEDDHAEVRRMEAAINRQLVSLESGIRALDRSSRLPDLGAEIAAFTEWAAGLRRRMLAAATPPLEALGILGWAERYRLAAEGARLAGDEIAQTDFRLMNSDPSL